MMAIYNPLTCPSCNSNGRTNNTDIYSILPATTYLTTTYGASVSFTFLLAILWYLRKQLSKLIQWKRTHNN